jgi:hypothetical protein
MGLRSTIVLTDAAGTPVNRSYLPFGPSGDTLFWRDRTQSIEAGQNRLSLVQRIASKANPAHSVDWRLEAPILAQTSPSTSTGIQPVPTVDHRNSAFLKFVMHERSDAQERKDLLYQMRDLIDEAIVLAQMESLDFVY